MDHPRHLAVPASRLLYASKQIAAAVRWPVLCARLFAGRSAPRLDMWTHPGSNDEV